MWRRAAWIGVAAALIAGCGTATHTGSTDGSRVAITVTEDGFVPKSVDVVAGKPVTLVVTRKTDQTCATDLVITDYDIKRDLPLGKPVEITFVPLEPGEIRYACGMDMIEGKIIAK